MARDGSEETFEFELNGEPRVVRVSPMKRLLDVLREDVGSMGTKEGCGEGECGACAVIVDDALVNSCLVPVAQVHGKRIRTIEGVKASPALAALQNAFVVTNGVQCGFCTPGMLMAAVHLLEKTRHPDEDEIREAMAGNLCRCTGYVKIVKAVTLASDELYGPVAEANAQKAKPRGNR
jgi:aerobic-type carbon monoxide dehydrogenase small subunit (CoxS/CutS family)